jgi:acetyl esterase/lipase
VIVHGGFWRDVWKRDTMAPLCAAVTQLGWSTVNVEYTRGRGSFPQAIHDIEQAIQWVRDNAEAYHFDPSRIVVIGHSAGGYLALKTAHADRELVGVIALAPVTDLASISLARPDDDPAEAFVGSGPDDNPDLWAQAALTGDPLVPVHLIHGEDDTTVTPSHTVDYVRDHAEMASRTMVTGVDHMGLVDPLCNGLEAIYTSLRTFNER